MALIRQSSTGSFTRDAIVLDLGDLSRQGEQIRARARAEADRIVAEAKAERDRLITGAVEEGRKAGTAQGLEAGRQQGILEGHQAALAEMREGLAMLQAGWMTALGAFDEERDRMLLEARQDVLRLAAVVAELVTKRAVVLDPGRVRDQLAAVLAVLARPTRLTVNVHPDDLGLVQDALPAMCEKYSAATHVEISPDPSLPRGSCVARSGTGGVIDASIRTQLDRIVELLLPTAVDEPIDAAPQDVPPPSGGTP